MDLRRMRCLDEPHRRRASCPADRLGGLRGRAVLPRLQARPRGPCRRVRSCRRGCAKAAQSRTKGPERLWFKFPYGGTPGHRQFLRAGGGTHPPTIEESPMAQAKAKKPKASKAKSAARPKRAAAKKPASRKRTSATSKAKPATSSKAASSNGAGGKASANG